MNSEKTFKARKLVKRIESLLGEIDVELRLGTARRHIDVRLELLGVKFAQLMQIHGRAHTLETKALEQHITEAQARVDARPTLRVV